MFLVSKIFVHGGDGPRIENHCNTSATMINCATGEHKSSSMGQMARLSEKSPDSDFIKKIPQGKR